MSMWWNAEVPVSATRGQVQWTSTSLYRGVTPSQIPPRSCIFPVINRRGSIVRRCHATIASGNNPKGPGLPSPRPLRGGRLPVLCLIPFPVLPPPAQLRPILKPLLDLALEAAVDRVVEHLARHAVGEIVLAGEAFLGRMVGFVALAVV